MTIKTIALGITAASLAALCGTALASTQTLEGVCATTGNPDAPYQFYLVDPTKLVKTDAADIFGVTSASQCPTTLQAGGTYTPSPSPSPSPAPSAAPTPTGRILSAQTQAAPSILPDTGGSAR
jgi:hypothetical protein